MGPSRWCQLTMDDWLDRFAPGSPASAEVHTKLRAITHDTFDKFGVKSFADIRTEVKMYAPFIALVQAILNEFGSGPRLEVLDTSHATGDIQPENVDDKNDDVYSDSDSENDGEEVDNEDKRGIPDCGIYRFNGQEFAVRARRSWHWIETLIKGATSASKCPFDFDAHGEGFLYWDDDGRKALNGLTRHMAHIFRLQHRTFAYAIYFFRNKARLVIFDRSGVAVSNWCYFEKDLHLQEFVYRLATASDAERGHDPSATLMAPNSQEVMDFLALADGIDRHTGEQLRQWVAASANRGCPIYKLRVPAESATLSLQPSEAGYPDGQTCSDFLVGRPHFSSDSLFGRCTRGYIAFDLTRKALCFLKDSWRAVVPSRTRPEHEVYERLYDGLRANGASTVGLPTLLCAGDVGGYDDAAQKSRVHAELTDARFGVLRTHYRLVLREIGVPLDKFPNFKSLLNFMLHAVITHADAWEYGGVLHSDISTGNILIKVDWESGKAVGTMLCDWDISKYKEELGTEPTPLNWAVPGTWAFKSALSLCFPWKAYELADDVESFVHVINYLVLKYHPTSLGSGSRLKSFVDHFFAYHKVQDAVRFGGDAKWQSMKYDHQTSYEAVGAGREVLQELIDGLAALCHNHYLLKRPWVEEELSSMKTPHPFPSMKLKQRPAAKSPGPPESIYNFELDLSDKQDGTGPMSTSERLPSLSGANPRSTQPPPLETTLQDHRGLYQALMAALKAGKWDMSDKADDQFEVFRETYKSPFRSNFSTSEQSHVGDSGAPSVAKHEFQRQEEASL